MASTPESRDRRPRLGERELVPGLRLIRARAIKDDFRRHSHRSILVGMVYRGQRRLLLPDYELLIRSGDGFYLPAALSHRCLIAQVHDYRVVSISPDFWRALTGEPAPGSAAILPAGSPAQQAARRLIATLRYSAEALAADSRLLALADTMGPCRKVADAAPAIPEKVLSVRDWLETHCTETVRLQTLAVIADCSPGLINRLFSHYIGLPPYEYLMQRRLGIAAQLLRESARSLVDIAYATGFADQSHLQRLFRRAYGTTPLAYRAASSAVKSR